MIIYFGYLSKRIKKIYSFALIKNWSALRTQRGFSLLEKKLKPIDWWHLKLE